MQKRFQKRSISRILSLAGCLGAISLLSACAALDAYLAERAAFKHAQEVRAIAAQTPVRLSERATPTTGSTALTPAHYEAVLLEPGQSGLPKSGLNLNGTGNLDTINPADAKRSRINTSGDLEVKQIHAKDLQNLAWGVFDLGASRPTMLEAVGGADIGNGLFSDLHFDSNEAEVLDGDQLKKLLDQSKWVEGMFYVVGYTDKTGAEKRNLKLSKERAVAVEKILKEAGVDQSRIIVRGAGVSRTFTDDKNNRHVSITYKAMLPLQPSGNGF